MQTEYGEYLSVFSLNAGKMRTRITPNTDTFYEVFIYMAKFIYDTRREYSVGVV